MEALTPSNGHPEPGILVDNQIRSAMAHGFLTIDPFDEEGLEPATYDLRVGRIGVVSTASQPIDLSVQAVLSIEPFSVALLQTEEILTLSPRLVGRVGPRSNVMRHGIFASTGLQIDPGFSGRLFVTLLNVTDHPFLIRHLDRFLTIEFHGLSQAPSRAYRGIHQGKTEPSTEEINAILSRGGPALKDIHRDMLELLGPIREAVVLGKELPRLIDLQQSTLKTITGLTATSAATQVPLIVPINTLASERHMMAKGIPAVVQPAGAGFTATYFDANVATSGDTQEEAVSNLKSLLIELFEDLETERPEDLGPEPARQLAVLREVIQRR
jgi:dCTP deaminase